MKDRKGIDRHWKERMGGGDGRERKRVRGDEIQKRNKDELAEKEESR